MFRSRFYRWKEFEEFHRASCGDFFIDIREEEFAQRKAIAEEILRQLQEEKGLSAEEILDQVEMRDFLKKTCGKHLAFRKTKSEKSGRQLKGSSFGRRNKRNGDRVFSIWDVVFLKIPRPQLKKYGMIKGMEGTVWIC